MNGTSLLDKKLTERKKLARKIIKESRGRVEFSFEEQGNTAKDIHDALNKVMEERCVAFDILQNAVADDALTAEKA